MLLGKVEVSDNKQMVKSMKFKTYLGLFSTFEMELYDKMEP